MNWLNYSTSKIIMLLLVIFSSGILIGAKGCGDNDLEPVRMYKKICHSAEGCSESEYDATNPRFGYYSCLEVFGDTTEYYYENYSIQEFILPCGGTTGIPCENVKLFNDDIRDRENKALEEGNCFTYGKLLTFRDTAYFCITEECDE